MSSFGIENSTTEFKQELTDRLEREVVAFLNSEKGGDIFIGVDDSGNVVGVENPDALILSIADRIKNNILPSCLGLYDVYPEEHGGAIVIHIVVSRGTEKPYYLKKYGQSPAGCYIRVGSGVQQMNIENRTLTRITGAAEREQHRLVDERALREALINAIVHNDYSSEVPPVVEIFADRISITSYGGLVTGLSEEEFFAGRSMPRNRELMRVFRDLDLVEQLGSGVHRILSVYKRDIFRISENFFEICFPFDDITPPVTPPVTHPVIHPVMLQVKSLLMAIHGEMSREELQMQVGLKDKVNFRKTHLNPALNQGLIEMTIPEKPNSRLQKYRLTESGLEVQKCLGQGDA